MNTQFLSDIIVTAVEGGTNYWAQVSNYSHADENTHATFHDMEDGQRYPITPTDVQEAIEQIIGGDTSGIHPVIVNKIAVAVRENEAGDVDADLADLIVQVACFTEVVYG